MCFTKTQLQKVSVKDGCVNVGSMGECLTLFREWQQTSSLDEPLTLDVTSHWECPAGPTHTLKHTHTISFVFSDFSCASQDHMWGHIPDSWQDWQLHARSNPSWEERDHEGELLASLVCGGSTGSRGDSGTETETPPLDLERGRAGKRDSHRGSWYGDRQGVRRQWGRQNGAQIQVRNKMIFHIYNIKIDQIATSKDEILCV